MAVMMYVYPEANPKTGTSTWHASSVRISAAHPQVLQLACGGGRVGGCEGVRVCTLKCFSLPVGVGELVGVRV
jgi:hypothetical protein